MVKLQLHTFLIIDKLKNKKAVIHSQLNEDNKSHGKENKQKRITGGPRYSR